MSTLSGMGQASASRGGGTSYAALRDYPTAYEGDGERELTSAERLRERRQRRHEEERASRRLFAKRAERRSRRAEAKAETRTEAPDTGRRESVSAYLGESTVVSVSTRSERRASMRPSGFTLVPPREETAWDEDADRSWREERPSRTATSRSSAFGGSTGFAAAAGSAAWDASPVWETEASGFDYQPTWEDRQFSPRETRETSRLPRRTRDGQTVQRDWLYTGEDEPQGMPGASRRCAAVIDAFAAIPRGIAAGASGLATSLLTHMRGLLVLGLAAFTAFMLYGPVRELYVANRRLDTLQATYDVLTEENDAIREDLELLQTREGIENEARARGYVEAGETKVIVEGLPEDAPVSNPIAFMEPLEIPDDRPWYIRMLDELFDYEME